MKIVIVVFLCLTFLAIGIGAGKFDAQNSLTREVNLGQVAVKGQNNFKSQILISYKDGKLDSIELVPGTTVLTPAPKK